MASKTFHITPAVLQAWHIKNEPKACQADIEMMERELAIKLPQAYVEFVMTYGFVIFGQDPDRRRYFDSVYTGNGQSVVRRGNIAFLDNPTDVIQGYRILTSTDDPDDETLPAFPNEYIPVGNDAGQGQILLEMSPQHGRVWYWKEKEWRWGTEDNTEFGFVANDFYDFINNLQPDPL